MEGRAAGGTSLSPAELEEWLARVRAEGAALAAAAGAGPPPGLPLGGPGLAAETAALRAEAAALRAEATALRAEVAALAGEAAALRAEGAGGPPGAPGHASRRPRPPGLGYYMELTVYRDPP